MNLMAAVVAASRFAVAVGLASLLPWASGRCCRLAGRCCRRPRVAVAVGLAWLLRLARRCCASRFAVAAGLASLLPSASRCCCRRPRVAVAIGPASLLPPGRLHRPRSPLRLLHARSQHATVVVDVAVDACCRCCRPGLHPGCCCCCRRAFAVAAWSCTVAAIVTGSIAPLSLWYVAVAVVVALLLLHVVLSF